MKRLLTVVSGLIAVVLGIVFVPGALAHGSTAATGTKSAHLSLACLDSTNPYDRPASVLRSCGDIIYPLRDVTALPGGGKAYDYGIYVQFVPPAGFSVLKASDRQLAEYGLPTRRELGSSWYPTMKDIRRFVQPAPYLVEVPAAGAATAPPGLATAACNPPSCSGNWSGYAAYRGHSYESVGAGWIEPHFVPTKGCSTSSFAEWTGIGGLDKGSKYLGQDGTAFSVPGLQPHQAFIDTINNDGSGVVAIKGLIATQNRKFSASTNWVPSLSRFHYLMVNDFTGVAWAGGSRRVSADLRSAEVIAESPTVIVGGVPSITNLSDFRSFLVTSVGVTWPKGADPLSLLPASDVARIAMRDNPGHLMAYPTSLTRTSNFSNVYYRCD